MADRAGGANTDGNATCGRPASRSSSGTCPTAQPPPSHPGGFFQARVRAQGERWAEAGEGPGATPEAMRRERAVASGAAPRLFLSWTIFTP